jgi:thiol-disulfide isomerase/thioredoxin
MDNVSKNHKDSSDQKRNWKRSFIEWGVLGAVVIILWVTGLHTQVIGTMQRGLLATGLIKPDIPSMTDSFPEAGTGFYFAGNDGVTRSLEYYSGDVVFMNVWATWCPPCIAEMPSIHALYNELKEDENITFLLVSMDEEFERAIDFMERRNFDMPIVHFRGREAGLYESQVIPTTYVITKDGRLAMEKQGLAKYDTPEFIRFMRELAGL